MYSNLNKNVHCISFKCREDEYIKSHRVISFEKCFIHVHVRTCRWPEYCNLLKADPNGCPVQLLYGTVQYSTVQYSTVQYSTVQYSTVHCTYMYMYTDKECR